MTIDPYPLSYLYTTQSLYSLIFLFQTLCLWRKVAFFSQPYCFKTKTILIKVKYI